MKKQEQKTQQVQKSTPESTQVSLPGQKTQEELDLDEINNFRE